MMDKVKTKKLSTLKSSTDESWSIGNVEKQSKINGTVYFEAFMKNGRWSCREGATSASLIRNVRLAL